MLEIFSILAPGKEQTFNDLLLDILCSLSPDKIKFPIITVVSFFHLTSSSVSISLVSSSLTYLVLAFFSQWCYWRLTVLGIKVVENSNFANVINFALLTNSSSNGMSDAVGNNIAMDRYFIMAYCVLYIIYIITNTCIVWVNFWVSVGSSLIYNTSARHEPHECDTSDKNATRLRHESDTSDTSETGVQQECNTSATQVLHERHECDTSEAFLILITTRVKTYFHTLILTLWQVKDYKERNNFILRTTFWKCLVSMPKCV